MVDKISFCIITIGEKPKKTNLSIKSIHRNFSSHDDYEIVIVGNNIDQFAGENVKLVEDIEFKEFLGARKNIGTRNSTGEVLVHIDDDIIFPLDWNVRFQEYNKQNQDWQILGHKFLLPDGNRFWDRNTYWPVHRMIDYSYESETDLYYQTGGLSICKRSLLDKIEWSDHLPFYAMSRGFPLNEDLDFSVRLHRNGIKIFFDPENLAYHFDYSYRSNGVTCNRCNPPNTQECDGFSRLIKDL